MTLYKPTQERVTTTKLKSPVSFTSPEYLAALKLMPKDIDGTVKDPRLIPKHRYASYLAEWREYAKKDPHWRWHAPFLEEIANAAAMKKPS